MLNFILEKSPLSGDAPCEKIIVYILFKRLLLTSVNDVHANYHITKEPCRQYEFQDPDPATPL